MDTTEKGLETLIVNALLNAGYVAGRPEDFDREHALDAAKLLEFLQATQPDAVRELGIAQAGPKRLQFFHRLQGELSKRGVVDVLRNGVNIYPVNSLALFYGAPTPGNTLAAARFAANIFSVTRQLRYSRDNTRLALDFALFINGLPVATFELKNSLTKQTVDDAVEQYKRERDPKELLFHFGRCAVHFAVDDQQVWMCPELKGKASWFLPFNKGWNDGAGNPPNPRGLKTAYLWEDILTKSGVTDILENYAQIVEDAKDAHGRKKYKAVFPRYHQLDVARKLLADAAASGVGRRYLIQHSAGSGKSNSIAWLAHQLIGLERGGKPVFDSVIVVTDRRILDQQICNTIKQFAQVSATVGHADHSGDLRRFLTAGKKIIITTVQKFPYVLDEIGNDHRGRAFAILIDEAHSSQGGRAAAEMNMTLAAAHRADDAEEDVEDEINRIIETRKLLNNASYFAFTATPKNKTLEMFGEPFAAGDAVKHRPFHVYTMKQAIQEGFILDVLASYTPVNNYYRLLKTIPDDPLFDAKKAQKKLRKYVETHDHAIRRKAEIMVDHFHEQVIARQKIGGQARGMIITSSIQQAIHYFHAVKAYLQERNSPFQAIVAFSDEHDYGGQPVTEATLNGFPSSQIAEKIRHDPYRLLIVADKFQTGYDEPLLHTMYVDKPLSGIKAVQTLSRLNRAHPQKTDTFILDFCNDAETIQAAFADYYRATMLSAETDPNKLYDLQAELDAAQVYAWPQVEELVRVYLSQTKAAARERLDPILDACVAVYLKELDEDGQVNFKGNAKAFVRTYGFLAAILPYPQARWEKLSTFLNFLIPKLPAPREDDLSRGILETIDMESYRAEVQAALRLTLPDENAEIDPVPMSRGGGQFEPELDMLSQILNTFNELFGTLFSDQDKVQRDIVEFIAPKVAEDKAFQNAKQHSDQQNARIEYEKALERAAQALMISNTEFFKQFTDNPSFRKWLSDKVFQLTYQEAA